MRRLTITTQESGARLREPGKTLVVSAKSSYKIGIQNKCVIVKNTIHDERYIEIK